MEKNTKTNGRVDVKKITTMGMLAGIGIVLVAFIEIPIFPAAPFLKYDPADIPILIGTMIYGPAAGFVLTVIVSFVQSFMIHGSGGWIGFVMHVVATGAMAVALGLLYNKSKKDMKGALVSLAVGAIVMVVAMIGMNLVFTPIFMGTPVDVVINMLVPVIIPFNIIKAGINCFFAFVLHKYVRMLIIK